MVTITRPAPKPTNQRAHDHSVSWSGVCWSGSKQSGYDGDVGDKETERTTEGARHNFLHAP